MTVTQSLGTEEDDLRARLGDLELLYSVADAVARAQTLDETLELALTAVTTALGSERAAVLLADDDGRLRFRAWRGLSDAYRARVEGNRPWAAGEPGEPVPIADVLADDRVGLYRDALAAEGIRALAFVPLLHQGRILGNLTLYAPGPHEWTRRELRFARAIASHVAAAAVRHRAQQQLEESRGQLEIVLRDVADGITVQDGAGRLLYANDAAARTIGVDSADELLAADPATIVERFEMLDEERRPLRPEALPGRRAFAGEAAEQLICYRLRDSGEERWSLVRATPVLNEAGEPEFAVNVIHDVTARRAAEERMRFLAEAGMVLSSSLDWEETLAAVARLAVPRVADWCIVYMTEPDGTIRRLALEHAGGHAGWVAPILDRHPLNPEADDGVPSVVRSGAPLVVGDMTASRLVRDVDDPEGLAEELAELEIGAYLCVPLIARGRTLGAIALMQGESQRGFGPEEQQAAEELARRAALAVDNALLFAEAERAARVERRRSEQLRRLSHAALLVNAATGVDDLVGVLTAQAREIIGARDAVVALAEHGPAPEAEDGALVAALVASDGRALGELRVAGPEEGAFTEEDEAILVQLARMTSVALENIRLLRESSRSLALLDALVGTAPIGVAFVDLDLRFVRINEAMAAMDGLAPAAHVGRRPGEVLDGLEDVELLLGRALARGRPILDVQLGAPDGRSFLASFFPVAVGDADPVGVGAIVVDVTDRERAAAERERLVRELESQRALFEAVLRQMPAGVVVTDADGGIVVSNEQAVELFQDPLDGREPGAAPTFAGYDERGRRLELDDWPLSRALAGVVVQDETIEVERADGTRRTLSLSAAPIHLGGQPVAAVATFGDVTERRRAEERLHFLAGASTLLASSLDYEATLRAVAQLAVPGIADLCSVAIRHDDGTLEELALALADPALAEWARAAPRPAALDPDASGGAAAVIRSGQGVLVRELTPEAIEGMAGGRPELREGLQRLSPRAAMIVPLVARDRTIGAVSFVLTAGSGRRFDDDDLLLARELAQRASAAVDNARLYRAEMEARREAEARATASQALEFVADAVALVDAAGAIRLWNPAAEAITGLAAGDVLGRDVEVAVPGWRALAARVPTARAGERGSRAETLPLDLDGRELWLSISAVEFQEGTVFAFRDVTEERGVERLKSDFVSTVSHELRTPLAAIYGAALTLRRVDTPVPEEHHGQLLGVIADEADRLARIVNDILWTSRIESGGLHVTIESCDPTELARAVVGAARAHLPDSVTLELHVEDGVPHVAADPDKVRQVLTNLVGNAIKYSPEGGPVEVRIARRDDVVRFSVSDRGLGVPVAERERIFEKFYRLDPDLNRGVGGTGLGLYISRELVRRMDGRIWVEGHGRRGSAFVVELPAAS